MAPKKPQDQADAQTAPQSPPKPVGRPDSYSPEIGLELCKRISDGRSLREVCLDEDMPDKKTVFAWLGRHEQFRNQYAPAREACLEYHADDILEIADNASNDWMMRNDPQNPGWVVNSDHINRDRLRIDARKWVLSKLLPKKYGDKIAVEQSGSVIHAHALDEAALDAMDQDSLMGLSALLNRALSKPKQGVTH